jgi:hypothetical protein
MNLIAATLLILAYPELETPQPPDVVQVRVAIALSACKCDRKNLDKETADWLDRLSRKKDEPTGTTAGTAPKTAPEAEKPRPQSAAPAAQPRPQVIEQRYYQPAYQVVPHGYYPQQVVPQGYYQPQSYFQSGSNCVSGA